MIRKPTRCQAQPFESSESPELRQWKSVLDNRDQPGRGNLFPNSGPRTYDGALQKAHTRDMFGCQADAVAVTDTQET
jgi:hypothetical protein